MLLTEVFNAPYEWNWTTTDRRYVQALFYDKDNTPYVFTASARDIAPMDQAEELVSWEIDFARKSKDGSSYSWDVTNTGDQHRILATIIDIMRKFVKARKVISLMFSAKEPSRAKLYQRIVKVLLPDWFYDDTDSFSLNVIYHPSQRKRLHVTN